MKGVRTFTFVGVSLGVALLLAYTPAALAQTFYGLAGGLNYSGPVPSGDSYSHGFAVQASVGRQLTRRLGVRLDAFASRFDDSRPMPVCILILQPPPGCSASGFVKPVGVAGLTANGLVNVTPPGAGIGMYLIAGGGAYYLYQHPNAAGAVRPETSAGAGFTVSVSGRLQVFVEGRYHDLLGAPTQPTWLVPVTFGVRF